MSTYTNTDNHPGIIKTERRIRPSKKIELHKAFRVPVEGLMPVAEEILIKKEKIKKRKLPDRISKLHPALTAKKILFILKMPQILRKSSIRKHLRKRSKRRKPKNVSLRSN